MGEMNGEGRKGKESGESEIGKSRRGEWKRREGSGRGG